MASTDLALSGDIASLAASLSGRVIEPRDPDYDEQRMVWNGSIHRRPAVIARCLDRSDVRRAVMFGRGNDLPIAVRGGGHSFPGYSTCDDGIVIDLGEMKAVDVDFGQRTVRVGAGALLGDLDQATLPHGFGVPAGIVSHTGVAGLTLGGGLGWQQRKYGLTVDDLLAVEMVTAAGEVVTASTETNADLFWGIRGGGGNFGIVTSFEFRLNAVGPQVIAGPIFWAAEDSREVLEFYREWIDECPDDLTTIIVQRRLRSGPSIPAELDGRLVLGVVACHIGPLAEAESFLQPLKDFGSPVLDLCGPTSFLEHQRSFDASFPHGCWYYVRSCDVDEITDGVIDVMADFGARIESPMSSIALWQMGGAVARVGDEATAFHGRTAGFTFNINGNTETEVGFADERQWARSYWDALASFHTSVYVNFLMDEGDDRIRQAYGPAKFARLKALKRQWDPDNIFRLNQNVSPD